MSLQTAVSYSESGTRRRPRRGRQILVGLAACLALASIPVAQAAAPKAPQGRVGDSQLLRVTAKSAAEVKLLVNGGFDLVEAREGNDYFVVGDAKVSAKLRAAGFPVRIEKAKLEDSSKRVAGTIKKLAAPGVYPTYYGGYRTVAAHEQHNIDVATNRPDLAQLVDYGDSWLKTQGTGGHDLQAICLTKFVPGDCSLTPSSTKPRTVVMASIHARELSTSEMAWRFIDYAIDNYNVLPDVTTLLDNQEIWVIPVVNPDGRDIVELGGNSPYLQRKNADTSAGGACANPPTVSNQAGVDLNRNAAFKWGGTGSSGLACEQTFRGSGPASEPEQAALQTLFGQLFADTRGPLDTDVAASTTTGALLSLHSYSNLTLLPWGWTTTLSPNNAGLRSLAFRMSFYNGYRTGTGPEILYSTTGTTDDDIYGRQGTPGFTIEIGPSSGACSGFTPLFSCQDTFWPLIRNSILALAKNSRQPYVDAGGPNTTAASTSTVGTTVTVNGTADDNAYGNATGSFGRPATQNINAAQYYLDVPPWAGGTAVSMTATDGLFNNRTEGIRATLSTVGLSSGRHTVYVRSRDTSNVWGPVTSAWFTVP